MNQHFSPEPIQTLHDRVHAVIEEVAVKYAITHRGMTVRYRRYKFSSARHEAFHRIQMEFGLSLNQIGAFFDGIDHTTVLYGIRKHRTGCGK